MLHIDQNFKCKYSSFNFNFITSRGAFQDGGRVAIHEANLNSESKPIYSIIIAKVMKIIKLDFNTNANSVITIS